MRTSNPRFAEIAEHRITPIVVFWAAEISRRVDCALTVNHFPWTRVLALRLLEVYENALVFNGQH